MHGTSLPGKVLCGLICALAAAGPQRGGGAEPAAGPVAATDLWTRPGEDWPGFLGPSGNGRSSLEGLATPWPAGGPRIAWHKELGEGYCCPAVALGRCVICDRVGREIRVRCLAAETGEELWQAGHPTDYTDNFGYDGGPRATAVIARDAVLTFGPDGRLVCRSLADGTLRWEIDTAAEYHVVQNFFGVGTAPLVIEGQGGPLVVVQVGGSRPGSAPPSPERLDLVQGLDSGLVAFDLATGRERWRSSAELASYSTPVLARVAGRDCLLAWMRDSLLVVDPATGNVRASRRWRADELFSVVAASPVVSGDEILLSETYGPGSILLKLDGDRLEELRRDPVTARRPTRGLRAHWATPVLHEGHVYGSSGRNAGDAVVVCADWKTGEIRWSVPGLGRASLALAAGHLIILGEFGDLVLAEATPQAYREVSRTRLTDPDAAPGQPGELLAPPCWAAPVIAHGYLFIRGQGRLVCVDLLAR